MKKSLLIFSLLCCSLALWAQKSDKDELKGAHPYKVEENENGVAEEIAHWSIIAHLGFSAFDGDFTSEMLHNLAVPSAGLSVEYNFTPIWNLGVEYMYDMYTVTGNPFSNNADTLLTGDMHKAGVYLSLDLVNLLFPKAKRKIVSIYPYVGGGAAWYIRRKYYMDDRYYDASKGMWINPTHGKGNTLDYINADGVKGPDYDKEYSTVGFLQAGLNFDFNLNRTLALGLRANYSYFTRDYIDGRGYHKQSSSSYASKNNDGIFDVTLNLRFKLEAVSKTHPRNMIAYDTWEQAPEPVHDTVIIKHDSIIIRETTLRELSRERKAQEQYYYVYFANASANLNDKSLITIQQVADRLLDDPKMYAVITGYCDNTAGTSYNYKLSDKRAANVLDELVAEYDIDTTRLFAGGVGKIRGKRSIASYGPNRRASIQLVDKATFERMKKNMDEQKENRQYSDTTALETGNVRSGSNVQTVPLEKSARPEKVNEYKQRTSKPIKTKKSTTLSKLARQYYNNTYCWVYIYIANKDKISNPNTLTPDMDLIIPELTEEEMRITKDQSLVLYGNARQQKQ